MEKLNKKVDEFAFRVGLLFFTAMTLMAGYNFITGAL